MKRELEVAIYIVTGIYGCFLLVQLTVMAYHLFFDASELASEVAPREVAPRVASRLDEALGSAPADRACAVCRENLRKVAAMPCGHFSYCFGCSERIGATCSVCRADVREFARVFA